jgi:hypothetical protein
LILLHRPLENPNNYHFDWGRNAMEVVLVLRKNLSGNLALHEEAMMNEFSTENNSRLSLHSSKIYKRDCIEDSIATL